MIKLFVDNTFKLNINLKNPLQISSSRFFKNIPSSYLTEIVTKQFAYNSDLLFINCYDYVEDVLIFNRVHSNYAALNYI